jgi:nicotinamide-nucleotide amidase
MKDHNINAEIITIGDEILIGQIVDTNSAWIAQKLNDIGINVAQITSISDNKANILNTLDSATSRADLIIVTGGLGPTKDDITKHTVSEYFKSPLVCNQEVLDHIIHLLEPRGIKINELNIKQADVPDKCKVLHNALGTAPGLWLEKDGKIFVFMPGVPFEMKYIVSEQLIPRLKEQFQTPAIVHKTLMLQGIAESMLAQHIGEWENQLPASIKLAYLPSLGLIRLRLTAKGDKEEILKNKISEQVQKLIPLIKSWYFADDNETIETTIGKLLKKNNKTLSVAESCTGGNIAHLITSVPGCSEYFTGGIVSYANQIKEDFLEIDPRLIISYGAVSKQVVELMATNVCRIMKTDYAVATSGIAGPDGGSEEKPVGTVWIAVASRTGVYSKKYSFGDNNRERNIQRATMSALSELRKFILEDHSGR